MNTNQEPLAWCKVNTNIFSLFSLLRFSSKPKEGWNPLYTKKQLDAAARDAWELGVAQEREACMNICEVLALDPYKEQAAKDCARKIRERRRA